MTYLKQLTLALLLSALLISCSKEKENFRYSGLIGLWKMDKRELQDVQIQMDHCQEETILSITDSAFATITYTGLTCSEMNSTESKYKLPSTGYFLDIPSAGDTNTIILTKLTSDEFTMEFHNTTDYENPDIIEHHTYKKLDEYPLPINEFQ